MGGSRDTQSQKCFHLTGDMPAATLNTRLGALQLKTSDLAVHARPTYQSKCNVTFAAGWPPSRGKNISVVLPRGKTRGASDRDPSTRITPMDATDLPAISVLRAAT